MKLSIPILFILVLVACSAPQSAMLDSYAPVYLPLVMVPRDLPRVGVEIAYVEYARIADIYRGDFAKYSLAQSSVPVVSGIYDWAYYDRTIQNDGDRYLTFRGRTVDPLCKFPDFFTDYPAWLDWVMVGIDRYHPQYVQFWNEPDTEFDGLAYHFGCIGEDYAAGVLYGQYYNVFYQRVKAQHHDIMVLSGELGWANADFIRGMFSVIEQTDGISFHHYAYCNSNYAANVTGIADMIDGLVDVPLYFSETSAIYEGEVSAECEDYKAEYIDWAMGQSRFEIVVLFTLNNNGWMNSWLEGNPAYYVYAERMTND